MEERFRLAKTAPVFRSTLASVAQMRRQQCPIQCPLPLPWSIRPAFDTPIIAGHLGVPEQFPAARTPSRRRSTPTEPRGSGQQHVDADRGRTARLPSPLRKAEAMATNATLKDRPKTRHPVDEILPIPKLAVYGFQHVLAFYAGAVIVPILLANSIGLTTEQLIHLINADLFTCGIPSSSSPSGSGRSASGCRCCRASPSPPCPR